MTIQDLINEAHRITGEYEHSKNCTSGEVGATLLTKGGNVYTGVSIDFAPAVSGFTPNIPPSPRCSKTGTG